MEYLEPINANNSPRFDRVVGIQPHPHTPLLLHYRLNIHQNTSCLTNNTYIIHRLKPGLYQATPSHSNYAYADPTIRPIIQPHRSSHTIDSRTPHLTPPQPRNSTPSRLSLLRHQHPFYHIHLPALHPQRPRNSTSSSQRHQPCPLHPGHQHPSSHLPHPPPHQAA